jgi:hypothetical protein
MLDVGLKCHVQQLRGATQDTPIVTIKREQLSLANVSLVTGLLLDNYSTKTLRIRNLEASTAFNIPLQSLREALEINLDGSKMGEIEARIVLTLIEDNKQLQSLNLHGMLFMGLFVQSFF